MALNTASTTRTTNSDPGDSDSVIEGPDLQATVSQLKAALEAERAERQQLEFVLEQQPPDRDLEIVGDRNNVYVFDDDDADGAAFDRFFTAPDPHLDKIRSFLLD